MLFKYQNNVKSYQKDIAYKIAFRYYTPSKRDTQSRCSLKTWSRAGYKLSADKSRVTPEQKTVLRV